jgi:hypothetical protein
MKKLLFLVAILVLSSCNSDKPTTDYVTINGDVQGLKMGKVLLQMVQDSVLVTLDSVQLDGSSKFTLKAPLDEPQLVILHLDVKDGAMYDDRVSIFAEDTVLTVSSTLNNFEKDIKVTGSKNNDILDEFKVNKKKLNEVYTELVKRSMMLNNEENPDPAAINELDNDYSKYLRKSVLYALNFAERHKDKEVAPYLIVTEAFDANPNLMDEVYQKMPKKIQTSYYGKQLSELIKTSKKNNDL